MTVGQLKEILKDVDDDVHLEFIGDFFVNGRGAVPINPRFDWAKVENQGPDFIKIKLTSTYGEDNNLYLKKED